MEKMYCVSCGHPVNSEDSFCFQCGAKVEAKKAQRAMNDYETSPPPAVAVAGVNQPRKRLVQNKKRVKKSVLIPLIILGCIAIPIVAISTVSNMTHELGTLDYEIPIAGVTDVTIDIYNDIGSITIYYDDSITNLFEAEITVKGGLRASFEDAQNFVHTQTNDSVVISFFFENEAGSFFNMKNLNHQIEIYINPIAKVNFDVEASTGSVQCYAEDLSDLAIEDLLLSSSTGSVKFVGEDLVNTSLGTVQIQSSTGGVTFDLEDSMNTTLESLSLDTSTGSVTVNLGENLSYGDSILMLSTSTGSVTLKYTNVLTTTDLEWDISTSTGSITLYLDQTMVPVENITMNYNVETSTGSVNVYADFTTNVGVEMSASTSTGSITLPNGHSYYISPDFNLKSSQYTFVLSTSTGSITASVNS